MAEQKIMKISRFPHISKDSLDDVREWVDCGYPISAGRVALLLAELDRLQKERDELYSIADEAGLV